MIMTVLFAVITAMLAAGAILRTRNHVSWPTGIQALGAVVLALGCAVHLFVHPFPYQIPEEQVQANTMALIRTFSLLIGIGVFAVGYLWESTRQFKRQE